MKSKSIILTSDSEVIVSKFLERKTKGGINDGIKGGKTLLKDFYKYVLSNIVVKVNGQSMYLVLQKKHRNVV